MFVYLRALSCRLNNGTSIQIASDIPNLHDSLAWKNVTEGVMYFAFQKCNIAKFLSSRSEWIFQNRFIKELIWISRLFHNFEPTNFSSFSLNLGCLYLKSRDPVLILNWIYLTRGCRYPLKWNIPIKPIKLFYIFNLYHDLIMNG